MRILFTCRFFRYSSRGRGTSLKYAKGCLQYRLPYLLNTSQLAYCHLFTCTQCQPLCNIQNKGDISWHFYKTSNQPCARPDTLCFSKHGSKARVWCTFLAHGTIIGSTIKNAIQTLTSVQHEALPEIRNILATGSVTSQAYQRAGWLNKASWRNSKKQNGPSFYCDANEGEVPSKKKALLLTFCEATT